MRKVIQRPDDAVFAWFFGKTASNFSLEGFTVYKKARDHFRGLTLELSIIGESDAVVVKRDGRIVFAELLACATPTGRPTHEFSLKTTPSFSFGCRDKGIEASTSVAIHRRVKKHLIPGIWKGFLFLEKPFGRHKPRTVVSVNVSHNQDQGRVRIHIRSRHDYLNGDSIRWDYIWSETTVYISD